MVSSETMPPDVMGHRFRVMWLYMVNYVVNIGHRFLLGCFGGSWLCCGRCFCDTSTPRHAMRLANLPTLSYIDPFSILQVSCHVTSNNEMLAKHEDGRLNWDASLTLPELPRSWRRFFPETGGLKRRFGASRRVLLLLYMCFFGRLSPGGSFFGNGGYLLVVAEFE